MAAVSEIPSGQRIPAEAVRILGGPNDLGPATPSSDHTTMSPYWRMADDLLAGQDAVKAGSETYLPKHPEETPEDYKYRKDNGVLTNIYADIIETLSSKPFDEEIQIIEGSAGVDFIGKPVMVAGKDTGRRVGGLIENIDGKGRHLHVFAHDVFYHAINSAVDWIFVDYPKKAKGLTAEQERKRNIRPYWYRIPAKYMLEIETAIVGGVEVFVYVRFLEFHTERVGYQSVTRERVREIMRPKIVSEDGPEDYGTPVWQLHQKIESAKLGEPQWEVIDSGEYSIGEIPLVPCVIGRRRGTSWVIDPPMKSAATLQIELYQLETGLKNVHNLVNYPMLSANGVNLKNADGTDVKIVIGPHTVLNAPPDGNGGQAGSWDFISPDAQGMEFAAKRIESTKQELRELGRQPLTAQSASLTVIASAFASQKANTAVEGWAIMLKDALENALRLTAMWMNLAEEPEIRINTDFPVGVDDKSADQIQTMRDKGDLSRKTYWSEMKRRNILSPDFDHEAEEEEIKEELPTDAELAAAAGLDDPANKDKEDPNDISEGDA